MTPLANERNYRSDKRVRERKIVLGIEVPKLIYIPHVELRCAIALLGSLHQKSWAAHFLQSHGHDGSCSRLPSYADRTNTADEWAWSPLTVSEPSCYQGNEEAKASSMLHMIPGMGYE
jgi:hypothetical protein